MKEKIKDKVLELYIRNCFGKGSDDEILTSEIIIEPTNSKKPPKNHFRDFINFVERDSSTLSDRLFKTSQPMNWQYCQILTS